MGKDNWSTKLPQIGGSLGEPRLSCCPTPYGPRRHGRENVLLVTLANLRLFWAGPFRRDREKAAAALIASGPFVMRMDGRDPSVPQLPGYDMVVVQVLG